MDRNSGFKSFLSVGRSPLLYGCGLSSIFGRVTYSQQVALLRVLAIASEKQLSLIDVLETFAKDVRGRWRYQILRLVDLLRSGVSLADAIEKIPTVIPSHAYFLVKAGAESGTLPSALALAAETCAERRNDRDFLRPGTWVYISAVVTIMLLVQAFICYWIIPKMKKIYFDFDMELPALTLELIQASDWFVNYFYLFPALVVLMSLLSVFLIKLGILDRKEHGRSFSGIYPRGRAPDVLRFLHVVSESGRPLLGAFETLTHTTKNRFMSQRFRAILEDIRRGNDCWTSLHDYSLLAPSEVRLLQSAQRAGNLSWALKAVAKSIERRIDYRMALVREYFEPAIILGIGCVVGVFVIGLFLPLVSLMNSLA
ncbi:MAG: type II secretion system F family protein [Planctomycetes bacterium]|nr:type II secretion system F family protein [Planctomycetota bacterium]MCH9725528.1 type II secretion system F family protein [Planctomycetota bacterium]MCH9776479.1 type II secretion system F family protein [Planctomycetota bacterium]MCH9791080.1 type II secretion system F family protein [Planctomycetota bacterium]